MYQVLNKQTDEKDVIGPNKMTACLNVLKTLNMEFETKLKPLYCVHYYGVSTTLCILLLIYHPPVKTRSDKWLMLCLHDANPIGKYLYATKQKGQ